MPTYYEVVGEEPTYELAENIIRATIFKLKKDSKHYDTYPSAFNCAEFSIEISGYRFVGSLSPNKRNDASIAIELIMKHFPDVLKKSNNYLYIKVSDKHLLNTNDLLVMDYYLLLLNQYEERVNKYQQYLKRQQDKQHLKLLFVIALPFILLILMILVGD